MNNQQAPKFWVYAKRKHNSDTIASLYVKIVFEGDTHEKSLGIKCTYDCWKKDEIIIEGFPHETFELKRSLDELKQKLMGAYYLLKQQDADFTLNEMLEVAKGDRKPGALSFCQCFDDVINRMEKLTGNEGYSTTNIQKHKRCLQHFKAFIKLYFNSTDLGFAKITRGTIEDLFQYLKSEGKCEHNSALKYLQIIKKVYRIGIDNSWVKTNAFADFRFRLRVVERTFLNEVEINRIQAKDFNIDRLNQVKDLFVFSCFTGLAYIDVKMLKRENIISNDGCFWIKCKRAKTNVEASIPLLPPAESILDKIHSGWQNCSKGTLLFDIISNQKINAYLKEIATICEIDKDLTFHLARHTFATTITLSNGIPIETVSKMLGHSRISMTQHYSKVVDLKISRDTKKLYNKFK